MTERQQKLAKPEVLGIDILRFVAALMVLCFHLCFWGFRAEGNLLVQMLGSTAIADSLGPFTYFGWVGVEIFFVISGFIIAYSAEGATPFSFFRGRFIRLMPSVWVCCVVSLPVAFWINKQPITVILKALVKSVVLFPRGPWIEGVLWTLVVEIAFYFAVFLLIYGNWFKYFRLVISVIGFYSSSYWILRAVMLMSPRYAAAARIMGDVSWAPSVQLSLLHYGCFFAVGGGLWLKLVKREKGRYLWLAPVIFLGCFLEIAYVNSTKIRATGVSQQDLVPFLIWFVCVILIVASVTFNQQIKERLNRFSHRAPQSVKWLGRMTYPLYLLHLPAAYLVIYFTPQIIGSYARWLLGLVAAVISAAVVTSFFEPWAKERMRVALDRMYRSLA